MSNGTGSNQLILYSTKAHVFKINPVTRSSWLSVVKRDQAIPISFVATVINDETNNSSSESVKHVLKLVGYGDNGETVFEGTIIPKTVFTKRSQKFGQWVDQAGTLHGLGFDEESELNDFMTTFQTLQRNILSQPSSAPLQTQLQQQQQPQSASATPSTNIADELGQTNSTQGDRLSWNNQQTINNNFSETNGRCQSAKVSPVSQNEWQLREQLKYENERLKHALEESSKNAGVWQNELLNLRTNNIKLTQALQESKVHVEEWERELLNLRDENKKLKLKIESLECTTDSDKGEDYSKDLQKYKSYVDEYQSELRKKETEIEELQKAMEELEVKSRSNAQNGHQDDSVLLSSHQRHKFDVINAKLKAKISELEGIQREFNQIIDTREDLVSVRNYNS